MSYVDDFNRPDAPSYNERTCYACGRSGISSSGRCYRCDPICATPEEDRQSEIEYQAERKRFAPGWHVYGWKPAKWNTEELVSLGAFSSEPEAHEAAKVAGLGDSLTGVPMRIVHRAEPKPYWGAV